MLDTQHQNLQGQGFSLLFQFVNCWYLQGFKFAKQGKNRVGVNVSDPQLWLVHEFGVTESCKS